MSALRTRHAEKSTPKIRHEKLYAEPKTVLGTVFFSTGILHNGHTYRRAQNRVLAAIKLTQRTLHEIFDTKISTPNNCTSYRVVYIHCYCSFICICTRHTLIAFGMWWVSGSSQLSMYSIIVEKLAGSKSFACNSFLCSF